MEADKENSLVSALTIELVKSLNAFYPSGPIDCKSLATLLIDILL